MMSAFYQRKMESIVEEYFDSDDAPILIIEGARQTGKTSLIRHTGRKRYAHYVEVNMIEDSNGFRFLADVRSTKELYFALQSIAEEPLGDYDDTLIFLDEIQEYAHLLTLLKFLREEHRYKFIASGSLLGIELRKTSSIPVGSISTKRLYPMDFEEFLWANGIQEDLVSEMKAMVDGGETIPDGLHRRMMDLFRDYLICGGLPACVSAFLETKDIATTRNIQRDIYEMYGNDATKYDLENKMHTKAVLDVIPSSIENKRKRIFAKDIEGKDKARFTDYKDDFENLVDSGVVLQVTCCSNPVFPLIESVKRNMLKLYLCDVGLLTWLLFRYNVKPLRDDTSQINLGNVYECFAAVQLAANGHALYYSDNKRLGEVDFLIDDYDALRAVALEIKSGKDYRKHNALDRLLDYESGRMKGIVLSNSRTAECDGNLKYMPIYALMFL